MRLDFFENGLRAFGVIPKVRVEGEGFLILYFDKSVRDVKDTSLRVPNGFEVSLIDQVS
jgi:hypothetical protein